MACRFFRKSKLESQLDSELRFDVELQTADNTTAGVNPDEVRRRALAQFGGLEHIKEETRDARGTQFIESLFQDDPAVKSLWTKPFGDHRAVCQSPEIVVRRSTVVLLFVAKPRAVHTVAVMAEPVHSGNQV